MSIFSDLKRVFFGAKSVAKHQGGKVEGKIRDVADDASDAAEDLADATKEAARDLMDKAPEYVAKGKDALEDLSDKIWREADAAVDKGKALKDQASDAINAKLSDLKPKVEEPDPFEGFDLGTPGKPGQVDRSNLDFGDLTVSEPPAAPGQKKLIDFESEFIQDAKTKAGKAASAANEFVTPSLDAAAKAGNKLAGKIGDVSESVGKVVMDKGGDLLDKAAQTGANAKDRFDDFVDHANVEAEKMRAEEAAEEARIAAEVAKARDKAFDGKEAGRSADSTLSGTDSFFDRADRFAKGDYHDEGGKDMTIKRNPNPEAKPQGGLIAGFNDNDGDGDSLIDDAIIEED